MNNHRKIDINNPENKMAFSNWLAQLASMLMTRNLYLVAGRGSSKTTEFLVERLIEMMYDLPGGPICWVSDTYANLTQNVLPMVLEGLERKGFHENIHYVVEKTPPTYTEAEKRALPEWLRPWFWKSSNKIVSYKHTIMFFTGFNITFGSLDRPASLAGRSYIHVIGDEVKYFNEKKIANLLKAVRGYYMLYGNSTFYRGHTFTTDMPDTRNIGEHDWILKQHKKMNVKGIVTLMKTAFVVNDCATDLIIAKQQRDEEEILSRQRIYKRWRERLQGMRMLPECQTFYYVASSYVNADILTPDYFASAFETDLGDVPTAILSLLPTIEGGDRFYANLAENHFYFDGADSYWAAQFGIREADDCRILKYLNTNKELCCGVDFGNMISMSIFQEDINTNTLRVLKFMDALSPEWIDDLAERFLRYFEPHSEKRLTIYYDRAGNNYRSSGKDFATELKTAIEIHGRGHNKGARTGWRVTLGSLNQGNIGQQEEYYFMRDILTANNPRLPRVLIDAYQCKPLKCSLELARTKKKINAKGEEYIAKDKSSEHLPIARLRLESTNPSDSFKYALMTKERRAITNKNRTLVIL